MKYSEDLLEHAEQYCTKLGLDPRLIHIPRTKIQADTLHEIQLDFEIQYRADYQVSKSKDIPNPDREQDKAVKAIQTLKSQLYKHHLDCELEIIAELTALEKRLDIDNRWEKPKRVFDTIIANITEQLSDAGFKDTNIKENILPIFSAMIKSE